MTAENTVDSLERVDELLKEVLDEFDNLNGFTYEVIYQDIEVIRKRVGYILNKREYKRVEEEMTWDEDAVNNSLKG